MTIDTHAADAFMPSRASQEPVRYVEGLASYYGSLGHPAYRWSINETAPFQALDKPLSRCRVSMLTSGGISLCSVPGFEPMARNDHRLDAIPHDASSGDFQIHDAYYDHRDADRDLNCQFPIDRLRELVANGEIGSLSPRLWSGFMGRIYDRSKVVEDSAPAYVAELKADEVDLLVAVPA
ncbi:MAG: glycine/sarcosine/betaine reductase selenoprotein B family protein [Pseudomonadales bacterium]